MGTDVTGDGPGGRTGLISQRPKGISFWHGLGRHCDMSWSKTIFLALWSGFPPCLAYSQVTGFFGAT